MDNQPADQETKASRLPRPAGVMAWAARQGGLLALAALACTVVAQLVLDSKKTEELAIVALAAAAVLMISATRRFVLERDRALPSQSERTSAWGLMVASLLLGLASWPLFKGNRFSTWGTAMWVAAMALMMLAARLRDPKVQRNARERCMIQRDGVVLEPHHLLLIVIMAVGAFFRLYRISEIPLEMGCDLPHIYSNIELILDGEYLVFFPSHPGREGLFFYLAAPVCGLFGLTHTTIKVASALVGIVTLPVVYALGKRIYSRQVGLVAAAALAISHWHIILTRVGFRACTVPLVISLIMLHLVQGMQTGRRWYYALAGIWLGLGLYTYNAMMLAPLVVAAMLLVQIIVEGRKRVAGNVERSLWLVFMALLAFVPLSRYAYEEPDRYLYRAATRITSMETAVPSDLVRVLAQNVVRSLSMFNYRGDAVFIANVPYLRQLGFVSAVLFLLGGFCAVWRLRRGHNRLVLISLVGMLMPTALAIAFPHEVPNAIRAIGALPAAALLVGLGWQAVWTPIVAQWPILPRKGSVLSLTINQRDALKLRVPTKPQVQHAVMACLVAAFVWEAAAVYSTYFDEYVSHLPENNYSISLDMAQAIDGFAGNGESYTVVWPYWFDGNAVRAQVQTPDVAHHELDKLIPGQPPLAGQPGRFMVLLHPDDSDSLSLLQQTYPRGVSLMRKNNRAEPALIIFYGER